MIGPVKEEKPSISKIVEELLSSKPFVQDLFRIDAINYSGLARHLVPEIQRRRGDEKVNMDAVIMAVKRFGDTMNGAELSEDVRRIISECSMFVKNDLTGFTVKKSNRIYDAIKEVELAFDCLRSEVIHMLQSTSEIEVVTERKIAKELLKRFKGSEILHVDPALALIGIRKPERATEIPGIVSHLSKFLAMNGISLIDTVSIFTEMNFVVHEKDASKAYLIIDNEIKKQRQIYGTDAGALN